MICEDIKQFWLYMSLYGGGVFVEHTGTRWYVGQRQHKDDVYLASFTFQQKPADLYADILREFRERVFIDNTLYHRDRFLKAALGYLYEQILEDGKTAFPNVTPGGKKYNRRRYER